LNPDKSRLPARHLLWPLLAVTAAAALFLGERWTVHDAPGTTFEVWYEGERLGEERMTYRAEPERGYAVLSTVSDLKTGHRSIHVMSEARFSLPGLVLRRYHLTNTGQMSMAEFTLTREDGHFRLTTGGSAGGRDLQLPAGDDTLLLDNNIAAHYQLLAWRWWRGDRGPFTCSVVVPQTGRLFEAHIEPGGSREARLGGRRVSARWLRLTMGPLRAQVWVDEATGDLLEVDLQSKARGRYRRLGLQWPSPAPSE